MRLLAILWCLLASAFCFSNDRDRVGPDGAPLRGKELWKTVSGMSPEDVDEVARIIAENREKVGDRLRQENARIHEQNSFAINQAKEYVEELKKSMRHLPGGDPPSITEINMRSGLDEVLVEGDIVMTPDEARHYFGVDRDGRRSKRQAYQMEGMFPRTLWSDGVPYAFDSRLNNKTQDLVHAVVKFWQENTCISFKEMKTKQEMKSSPVKPVLVFFPGVGCYSKVGRDPTGSNATMQGFRNVAHEIGHALGFIHEHTRWDRDKYIYVEFNKTDDEQDAASEYYKAEEKENNNYGKQYDFGGVMHYKDTDGVKVPGEKVMFANNPDYQMTIGNTMGPMYGDVYEMNMLYSCYVIGSGSVRIDQINATDPHRCTWHITAPEGMVIEYRVTFVGALNLTGDKYNKHCREQCYTGGVKIKGLEKTWIPEGMRFCCSPQFNKIMATSSNLLVVEAYNFVYYTDFAVEYRIKPVNPTTPTPRVSGCPASYDIPSSSGTECYNVNIAPKSYSDAFSSCLATGGTIWMSQGVDERMLNDVFITKAGKLGIPSYWRGIKDGKCGIYDFRRNSYTYTECDDKSQLARKAGYICHIKRETPVITATTQQPVPLHFYGDYILGLTPLSFAGAKARCEELNAHLISLHKSGVAAEIQHVYNLRQPGSSTFWIGLHKDLGLSSPYTWVDGSRFDYKNWSPGYPGKTVAEKCGAYSEGKWIALRCDKPLLYVCEK
uniref:Metalloendopeptidase n=1 Tax=Steinernema glaseri TaxID=37863 RepID=A0A1I7Y5I2_9BILA